MTITMPCAAPEAAERAEHGRLYPARQRCRAPEIPEDHRWGVILAGGDGTRLLPLTRLLSGDERPKQFCRLFGGKTLLTHTRERVVRNVAPDHILYALTQAHQPLYSSELSRTPPIQLVVQPHNRGTLPAVVYSLQHLSLLDECAVVAFLPADHYYEDEDGFRRGLDLAFEKAETKRGAVILLGVRACSPEVEYGWIEPTNVVVLKRTSHQFCDVRRFWEKPPIYDPRGLLRQGCLWNTFTMVGSASAFLRMIELTAPDICRTLARVVVSEKEDAEEIQSVYERLPCSDFSREILSKNTNRLSVLSLGDVGWSDLGDPSRVLATLARKGLESEGMNLVASALGASPAGAA